MTGKEAFQDVIAFCEFLERTQDRMKREKDPFIKGTLRGIELVKAGVIRKRDREEEEENVQS